MNGCCFMLWRLWRIENISWVILVSIFLPLNRLHGMIICTLLYFHFSLLLQIFATTWTKGLRVRVATTRPLNFISSYSKSSNLKCLCCFIYVSLCFCGPLRMNHFSGAIWWMFKNGYGPKIFKIHKLHQNKKILALLWIPAWRKVYSPQRNESG